jgi:radical SAM superfamily enzyme YgiQ (UPF0313 family)
MYGFPGEDIDSIKRTEDFFKAIDHQYIGFTTTPIPGTKLYEQALQKGLIADEEEYLLSITGGYNRDLPLVNLTEFNDHDYMLNKITLRNRVNKNYYLRHPLSYLIMQMERIRRIIKKVLYNPRYIINKLNDRLSIKYGAKEKMGPKVVKAI